MWFLSSDWTWYIPQVADASGALPISAMHTLILSMLRHPTACTCDSMLRLCLCFCMRQVRHNVGLIALGAFLSHGQMRVGEWIRQLLSLQVGQLMVMFYNVSESFLGPLSSKCSQIIFSVIHLLWALFPSLPYFLIPLPVFPKIIHEINYFIKIFISE